MIDIFRSSFIYGAKEKNVIKEKKKQIKYQPREGNFVKSFMYGQKQIFQCLAVALALAIFSFHRSAIKQNKEIRKNHQKKFNQNQLENTHVHIEHVPSVENPNLTGYCMKYPFGQNVYANHDSDIFCHSICFDKFETWLRKQCQSNCCVHKTSAPINGIRVKSIRNPLKNRSQTPRNCENALMEYIKNSAPLHREQCKALNINIEPTNQ